MRAGSWLQPLRDTLRSFAFGSREAPQTAPYIRDPVDIKRLMATVVLALLPCTAAALYFFGLRVAVMIAVSYAAGGLVEVAVACIRRTAVNEGFLVTGLLLALILPPTLPLWMVATGVVFGVLVGKELFGGTGRNLFNPALVGRCFLMLSYPEAMSQSWRMPAPLAGWGALTTYGDISAVTSATPLTASPATWSLWDLAIGHHPGSAGETCVPAIAIGAILLWITGAANLRATLSAIATFTVIGQALNLSGVETFGALANELLSGGFLFAVAFMATDPVTSPMTNTGRWIQGALIGGLTVSIRTWTGWPEGAMFATLLANLASPLLDEAVLHVERGRLRYAG